VKKEELWFERPFYQLGGATYHAAIRRYQWRRSSLSGAARDLITGRSGAYQAWRRASPHVLLLARRAITWFPMMMRPALGKRRARSPSMPFIGFGRALVRARILYDGAAQDPLTIEQVAGSWGMAPKSSAVLQTIAALLAYGLAETGKKGDGRQIAISDRAVLVLLDSPPDPVAQQQRLMEAALAPELIADYAALWWEGRPADHVCMTRFMSEHGFTELAARRFLRVFDEAMWFVGGGSTGIHNARGRANGAGAGDKRRPRSGVRLGDYVRCASGAFRFMAPRQVVWLADDGRSVYLQGTFAAIAATEVKIVDPPPPPFSGDLADPTDPVPSPYPFPDFYRAMQATRDLIDRAGGEWLSLQDAASVWFQHPERDEVLHCLADLLAFGLGEQRGIGKGREVRVTELGWRCLEPDLDARYRALGEAALKSELIADYAARWQHGRPEDEICVSELMRERGFSEKEAVRFLRVFDQVMIFINPPNGTSAGPSPERPAQGLDPGPTQTEAMSDRERNRLHLRRRGERRELNANVDLAGLAELQEELARYERDWRLGSREHHAGS
jgi:hypothetical protein